MSAIYFSQACIRDDEVIAQADERMGTYAYLQDVTLDTVKGTRLTD